ncbi:ATP-dependent RNA helicase TDRD9 [Xyrichtys novacula]|uniref:ATP-dependent RNA helicase TDRD9 n=1 Tax=Xyrichtys novacula TaxID=13765 RepID=A0AAV1GKI1_XYRNO|nr:ATP-dependent RNA helicase TDRD9 [Xyrichtys novacula]
MFEHCFSPSTTPDEGSLKDFNSDGDLVQKENPVRSTAPPPHESYEYPNLPITKNRQELVSLVENNSVVIVKGATGSGKTTQLPQYILDHYNEKNAPCNIVVTQPHKIGARNVAQWIAKQRKCTLGSLVGYQIALEKIASEHTRLIYMTTGVLLQKLVSAKCLTMFTHIFVDEVHEHTEEMDLLLLVLRKLLDFNSRFVKIILMSATVDCRDFAEYFGSPIRGWIMPAAVFEVEGVPYTIEEFYLEDLYKMFPHRVKEDAITDKQAVQHHPGDLSISVEMYNLAVRLVQSLDEMEGKDFRTAEQGGSMTSSERGSVLIFLPGLAEISSMQEALATLVHRRLLVYRLHSTVPPEEQNGVFLPPVPGYRKVILSTNIAESTVTVPDVKYVVDFCLVRQMVCDPDTNYQSLRLTWASKTNCNQRKGRAGRVSKGYCYRLVTKEFWRKEIPEYMIPQMLLAPLATVVLKVKLLDMGDPRCLLSTALSPPSLGNVEKTVLQLIEMGALSARSDEKGHIEDGNLTFLGRVQAHLPVDLYLGKLIVLGHAFGCLDECLIIAASHSVRSFFVTSFMQQLAGNRSKLAFARGTSSDSLLCLNAFRAWQSAKKEGKFRHPKDQMDWGKENFIHIKRIREVEELYEELKKRVSQFNMHVQENTQPLDYTSTHRLKFILQVVMAGALYPNYFVQGEIDDRLASRDMCGSNARTTVMLRKLPPYSFLYYKQLQSLFRQCGQVKTISFECSRAYVEFQRTSRDSGVLPEVSLALLMGMQRPGMELRIHPIEQIETFARSCDNTDLKCAWVKVDVQSQTASLVNSILLPEKLPPHPVFPVNVTEVFEVGKFWGFMADEASLQKQRSLTGEINRRTLHPVTVSLYPNLLCLAHYSEDESLGSYYRAKILHIGGNKVEVFFLDFGDTEVVDLSSLREIPSDLLNHPFQAQEFKVAEMRPSAQSIILGNQWSSSARSRFYSLVSGQTLLVKLYSILHDVMHVQLLINTETTDTTVLDIMVEEGHAVKAEESFDSEMDHERLMNVYSQMERGTYTPNYAGSSWMERMKKEQELIDRLLDHFSESPRACFGPKLHLHGPSSPNKIFFHCLGKTTLHG